MTTQKIRLFLLLVIFYAVKIVAASSHLPLQNTDPIANFALNENDTTRYTQHADTDDFTSEGIRYYYDNTYVDGHYYSFGSMSCKQNSEVTAYYNGLVLKGSINLFFQPQRNKGAVHLH